MNFQIEVLGTSNSGNSYFVKVRSSVKSGFGTQTSELGIGYITKTEDTPELEKGAKVNWSGNVQFQPITNNDGEVTTVNGAYLHRVNLVDASMPFVAPIQAKPVEAKVAPKVDSDPIPANDGDPLGNF